MKLSRISNYYTRTKISACFSKTVSMRYPLRKCINTTAPEIYYQKHRNLYRIICTLINHKIN